ncbi:MAG: PHP domain-containing protein [Anaerovoracaceae bacterium]|jgi:putative hydrolase
MNFDHYRMTFDYHTHTTYSHGWIFPHGKGTIRENVEAGIAAGLDEIAISEHGPGHVFYGVKRKNYPKIREEIRALQEEHPEIRIWMSVEANVLDGPDHIDLRPEEFNEFDFVLAGYHYGVGHGYCIRNWLQDKGLATRRMKERLRDLNTEMVVKCVEENDIRILTHPGDKAPVDMAEVARACAKTDTWMEISTWHKHLTVEEIRVAMKEDVRFVISSDAHTPGRVGSFQGGLERAYEAGLDFSRIVNIREI